MKPLKLCLVTAEIHPFSKTGGLADVSAALSAHLHRAGHDVRVFSPLHSKIDRKIREFRPVESLEAIPVRLGGETFTVSILKSVLPGTDLDIHFIDCPALYDRPTLYTNEPEEALRFAVFSCAVIQACQWMKWAPDVFHVHDWHASLTPLYLKTLYAWDALFQRSATVLTIHNIGYQGIFPSECLAQIGLDESVHFFDKDDVAAGNINYLRTGITHADLMTTVSPTYAREIQTPEFGAGLETLLRERSDRLVGILNGVDYDEWDPSKDRLIPSRYSARSLPNKGKNRKALLEEMGLPAVAEAPVIGIISRLTVQKGFELCFKALPAILKKHDLRLVVLGTGEEKYERFFKRLQTSFRGKVRFYKGFSNELAHLIEAGSDMFLMPSLYEPCGLNQMYSLRYGTVPIVRRTGGLADTVEPFDPATGEGTGFVFDGFTPEGLRSAIEVGLKTFENRKAWRRLVLSGMSRDFSWDAEAPKYVELFARLASSHAH